MSGMWTWPIRSQCGQSRTFSACSAYFIYHVHSKTVDYRATGDRELFISVSAHHSSSWLWFLVPQKVRRSSGVLASTSLCDPGWKTEYGKSWFKSSFLIRCLVPATIDLLSLRTHHINVITSPSIETLESFFLNGLWILALVQSISVSSHLSCSPQCSKNYIHNIPLAQD